MKLNILHLYPDLMSIYGDRGNILALTKRTVWRNIAVNLVEASIGDRLSLKDIDLIFFGGGQDKEQVLVCEDLQADKKFILQEAVESGTVMLGICGGFQLLGKYYRTGNGKELPGCDIMQLRTEPGAKRMIGNVILQTPLSGQELVGFENHSGRTYLSGQTKPLGQVVCGFGNNGEDGQEGAVYKNCFGTYLHGPLLPKNPWFADYLIELALQRKYGSVTLSELDDRIEGYAHKQAKAIAEQKSKRC